MDTTPDPASQPQISLCILNLNAAEYLRACLDSLPAGLDGLSSEVIVVDNGSTDGSQALVRAVCPQAQLIENADNRGYTAPMNQALRAARGRYLVQLNPDTLAHPAVFRRLYEWMEAHPQVGICSPKVLNRDGTLQRQCRRSAARPWDVISYFSGLWKLFPRSRFFGRYLISYRGDDETFEVEAVSGSCMLIRRAVTEQIGFLDEVYFAYQEDTDFCVRAREAGWQVYYYPGGQITHFGGQGGSTHQAVRAIIEWHRSYLIYYRRHLARQYFFGVNWLMYAGMGLKLALALLANALRKEKVVGTRKP